MKKYQAKYDQTQQKMGISLGKLADLNSSHYNESWPVRVLTVITT